MRLSGFILLLILKVTISTNGKPYMGLSFDPENFMCVKFGEFCDNILEEIGCGQNSTVRINTGCPNNFLPDFTGTNACLCRDPVYYDATTRVVQQLIGNRINPEVHWMLEPWNSGPPYDIKRSYTSICGVMLDRIGCPAGNQTIIAENFKITAGVKSPDFKCSCGLMTVGDAMINNYIMDNMNDYDLKSTPIFADPVYLSVPMSMVFILICGKIGAIAAVYLKLPPIIGFMMGGLAIQNILNPMFLHGVGYPYPSPASEIKIIALIIVLMRSGLSIKFDELKATAIVSGVFSWLPYFAEFFLWMYIGVYFFHWRTIDMGLMASIMAPLGPSVVLSGLLQMVGGKKNYGYVPKQMIITTPIEAVIAIVLFGIFSELEQAAGDPLVPWMKSMPLWESCVLIPVNLLFSIVMGVFVGWFCSKYINWRSKIKSDFIWVRASKNPQMGSSTADLVYVLVVACYCMYSLCNNSYIQQSSGVLVVFVCCITVSKLTSPAIVIDLAQGLKGIWVFAEVFLFTLIGTSLAFNSSNGPLYGQRGLTGAQIQTLMGMMFIGITGRLFSLALSTALVWKSLPPHRQELRWCGPFVINCWFFQMPKATIQATLGAVAYSQHTIPGAVGLNRGLLIMQYTAFTVLIFAPLGSLLSVYVGGPIAMYLKKLDDEANFRGPEEQGVDDDKSAITGPTTGPDTVEEDEGLHEMQTIEHTAMRARAMTIEMVDYVLHPRSDRSDSNPEDPNHPGEPHSPHHDRRDSFFKAVRRNTMELLSPGYPHTPTRTPDHTPHTPGHTYAAAPHMEQLTELDGEDSGGSPTPQHLEESSAEGREVEVTPSVGTNLSVRFKDTTV